MKKLFSIVLALTLVFGNFCVVSAEENNISEISLYSNYNNEEYKEQMAGPALKATQQALRWVAKELKSNKHIQKMSDELIEHSYKIAKELEKTARNLADDAIDALNEIQNAVIRAVGNVNEGRKMFLEIMNNFGKEIFDKFKIW